jgi:single-strand DNA-binding protein
MKIQITIVGNLTADPELRFTPGGKPVVNFVVACSDRKFDKDSNTWVDLNTTFITCTAWNKQAENIAESLQKGMAVIAQGVLRQHDYIDKNEAKQRRMELECDVVGAALTNAIAKVERIKRDTPPAAADPWATATQAEPPF